MINRRYEIKNIQKKYIYVPAYTYNVYQKIQVDEVF